MPDHNGRTYNYFVGSEGPMEAEIAFVAEKPADDEVRLKRPLIGASGDQLRTHVTNCGLKPGVRTWNKDINFAEWTRSENVYFTNACQYFDVPDANPTLDMIWREQTRLVQELSRMPKLKVIVPLGNYALASLGNMAYSKINNKGELTGIAAWRGSLIPSIIPSRLLPGEWVKMLPTFHPSFYMHDNWQFKDIVYYDIKRASAERFSPGRIYRERTYAIRPDSIGEAMQWFDEIERDLSAGVYDFKSRSGKAFRFIATDIEAVKGRYGSRYVCCFSVAIRPEESYCFPITYNNRESYWGIAEEILIWKRLQKLFNRTDCMFTGQNYMGLDAPVLRQHGIVYPCARHFDSMTSHSQLCGDLPHDLGFLCSIFIEPTDQYYKAESGEWDSFYIKVPEDQFWVYSAKDSCYQLECTYGIINDLMEVGR